MVVPDTISVFYYSQHALVLAINIPVLAIASSQKKKKRTNPNNQKHQRAWKMFGEAEECCIYLCVLQLINPIRIWTIPKKKKIKERTASEMQLKHCISTF